ncbi:hypothetical protein U1E44_11085 [Arenibacter sp. GZD96]|uniref:hypothetical protein n=1 Tax=Aurantibrevibacter litoralis TaxID=3106030 RepID=UPI002AFE2FBB|nr:hypothetical protein [Arenibacter sp. GZD-96]MEA1786638.1 hypothetical protein [Arenibacter sp. GZD-96]
MSDVSLTAAQLKSIATYLKNSDVRFIDVRMELVDHIALSVAQKMILDNSTFYDAFKDYMVAHKQELLKDYERGWRKLQLQSFKMVFMQLKNPVLLVFSMLFFVFLALFSSSSYAPFPHLSFQITLLGIALIIYALGTIPYKKHRYSVLQALLWPLFFLTYLLLFAFNVERSEWLFFQLPLGIGNLGTTLYCGFVISVLILFFKMRKAYGLKYSAL